LHNLALFWVKNANFFAKIFGENILKIITSVPGHPAWHLKLLTEHASLILSSWLWNLGQFFQHELAPRGELWTLGVNFEP
jgi:hypothetical protein